MDEGNKVGRADEDQEQLQQRLMGYAAGALAISSLTIGDRCLGPAAAASLPTPPSTPLYKHHTRPGTRNKQQGLEE